MGRVAMTVLDSLASLIGFSEACVIAAVYGGRSLYVPKALDAQHPLALLIGVEAAQVLVHNFGGGEAIKIPSAFIYDKYANMMRANQMAATGSTTALIAKELKVSVRTVHDLLRSAKMFKLTVFKPNRRIKKHKDIRTGSLPLSFPCESPDPRK